MNQTNLSFSVIIPVYNSENTIIDTLESIRLQTARDLIKEIVVVDDGSTDSSGDVIKAYSNKHPELNVVLIRQPNKGVSAARNKAINAATAPWVALIDSDDQWKPEKISVCAETLRSHPDIHALGTNRNAEYVKFGAQVDTGLRKLTLHHQLIKYWPSTPSLVIYKEIFKNIGMFDENQHYAEDGNLFMRISYHYGMYYLEDSLLITANKPLYGASGLSGNIKAMHEGCIKNVNDAYSLGYLSRFETFLFKEFENMKYLRRILVTKLRAQRGRK